MKTLLLNWEQRDDGSYYATHPAYPYDSDKAFVVRKISLGGVWVLIVNGIQRHFPGSHHECTWAASHTALADLLEMARPSNPDESEKRHAKKLLDAINQATVDAIRAFNGKAK